MIHVPAVGLSRILNAGENSPLAPTPVGSVTLVPTVKPVNSSGAGEQPPSDPSSNNRPSSNQQSFAPQLSRAAQLVQTLLRTPAASPEISLTGPSAPLLAAPSANGAELAKALTLAVATSGLFYESHLAAWAAQQRSVADLQQEPQGQWPTFGDSSAPGTSSGVPDPVPPSSSQPSWLPDNALPLVRLQLHTLETRCVTWRGEVWPKQQATLTITEKDRESDGEDASALPRHWHAELDVVLPTLGGIHADLYLNGDGLRLLLSTASRDSIEPLRAARSPLVTVLAAQALNVTAMTIRHDARP